MAYFESIFVADDAGGWLSLRLVCLQLGPQLIWQWLEPFIEPAVVPSIELAAAVGTTRLDEQGDVRVCGSLSAEPQKPLLGFIPIYTPDVSDSFIMSPDGRFVGGETPRT